MAACFGDGALEVSATDWAYRFALAEPLVVAADDPDWPSGSDLGDWISGIGEAVGAIPGAAFEAAGRTLQYVGNAVSGVGNMYKVAGGESLGRTVAGMMGSSAATALLIAGIQASPTLALGYAALMVTNPLLGTALLAGAVITAGVLGQIAGQSFYDDVKDIFDGAGKIFNDWFGPDGPGSGNGDGNGPGGLPGSGAGGEGWPGWLGGEGGGWPSWFEPGGPFYFPPISPLVLDLDGDGLDLLPLAASNAHFDLDENGFAEATAWIGPDDAFLVVDANQNGRIDDLSEMFGGQEIDGFSKLTLHDENGDGIINAEDSIFSQLLLWRDANGDGVTQDGELVSIQSVELESIDLNDRYVDYWSGGNWISHESAFATRNGGGVIYDVWFENDQLRSIYLNAESHQYGPEVMNLPKLAGYGTVAGFSARIHEDSLFASEVEALVLDSASLNLSDLRARIETLLLSWAGVADVPTGSAGVNIDAQHLAFLEALHGQEFDPVGSAAHPGPQAAAALESYYQNVIGSMIAKIAMQLPLAHSLLSSTPANMASHPASLMLSFVYNADADRVAGNLDIFIELLVDRVSTIESTSEGLSEFVRHLEMAKGLASDLGFVQDKFRTHIENLIGSELIEVYQDVIGYVLSNDRVVVWDGADSTIDVAPRSVVVAGGGDDSLNGSGDDDIYIFTAGDGDDRLNEPSLGGRDELVFAGLEVDDVAVSIDGGDIILTILSPGGGSVRLVGQVGALNQRGVEYVRFSDGVVWSASDLRREAISQATTSGDDVVQGTAFADVIEGAGGDDTINGGDGDDAYRYSRGDGQDVITEDMFSGDDALVMVDVNPTDVTLTRSGNDVILVVSESAPGVGDGGSIRIVNGFNTYYERGVEIVQFATAGVSWTQADIRGMLLASASTAGADVIAGSLNDDVIDAGGGDDAINGGDGDDTYHYVRGDGHDIITEEMFAGEDVVVITGVDPEQATLSRSGTDVIILIGESVPGAGDEGSIRIVNGFSTYFERGIEAIRFPAAGVSWSQADVRTMIFAAASTPGADVIAGSLDDDLIQAGGGNDTLNGGDGDDTYRYTRGDGDDVVTEDRFAGDDVLILTDVNANEVTLSRSGEDVIVVISESAPGAADGGSIRLVNAFSTYQERGVETIRFATSGVSWSQADVRSMLFASASTEGSDTIAGSLGDDIIEGGGGDDAVNGGDGDDTYRYARGDGGDVITEDRFAGDDVLIFTDVDPSHVTLSRSGEDVILIVAESAPGEDDGAEIRIVNGFSTYQERGIELVRFAAAGVSWSQADIRDMILASAATEGADTISGSMNDDVIEAGGGDDVMNGGDGDDTYRYVRGDGNDIITEAIVRGADTLELAGIDPTSVTLARVGSDLIITIAESGPGLGDGGSITLKQSVGTGSETGVERIAFEGGTVWNKADVLLMLDQVGRSIFGTFADEDLSGTPGDDLIYGFAGEDVLIGGAGDDELAGGDGNDLLDGGAGANQANYYGVSSGFVFERRPDGAIVVSDAVGDEGVDTLFNIDFFYFAGDEAWHFRHELVAAYGTTGADAWLPGTDNDDNIWGLAGDDTLIGYAGDDIIDGGAGFDQANFLGSLDQYSFVRAAGGEVSVVSATGEGTDVLIDVEALYFEASTTWVQMSDVVADYGTASDDPWLEGTVGNDDIWGLAGDDTLIGRAGNDALFGGEGYDQANYAGAFTGFNFQRAADGAVVVRDAIGQEGEDRLYGIEAVYFEADQTWRALAELVANYGTEAADAWVEGTVGDDDVYGLGGDDALVGREGDDRLYGGEGFDQANYFGASTAFSIVQNPDGTVTITDLVGDEGSDILDGVEALYFEADQTWTTIEDALATVPASGGASELMTTSQFGTSEQFIMPYDPDFQDLLYRDAWLPALRPADTILSDSMLA